MKERAERLEADRDRVVSEAMEEKVKLERDLTDTKADLAKAIISARRAERMAMQAKNEREEQVGSTHSSLLFCMFYESPFHIVNEVDLYPGPGFPDIIEEDNKIGTSVSLLINQ